MSLPSHFKDGFVPLGTNVTLSIVYERDIIRPLSSLKDNHISPRSQVSFLYVPMSVKVLLYTQKHIQHIKKPILELYFSVAAEHCFMFFQPRQVCEVGIQVKVLD